MTKKIHYVGDQILFVQKSTSPSESYQYLHRDHIGPLDDNFVPTGTARGFTDHEHLDSVGLIHMNGRVYDQELGRFLSADPLIQAPHNTQSYNRYSYAFNNPLSFVDPSGFATEEVYVPGSTAAEREAAERERKEKVLWDSYIQSLMQESNINQMVDMYNTTREMQRLNQTLRHQSILGLSTKGTLSELGELKQKKSEVEAKALESLEGLMKNDAFVLELQRALSYTGSVVRYEKQQRNNVTVGLIVRMQKGVYVIEPKFPDRQIPSGYENKGWGLWKLNFGYSPTRIQNAAAVVISLPVFVGDNRIVSNTNHWNNISRFVGSPVIIRSDAAKSNWMFYGYGEPIAY